MKALRFILVFFLFFLICGGSAISSNKNLNKDNRIDVTFYKLDLNVGDTSIYIRGSATIKLKITARISDGVDLELSDTYKVDSVLINGVNSVFNHNSGIVSVEIQDTTRSYYTIEVFYNGYGYLKQENTGIYNRSNEYGDRYTYTLTEPFSANYVFPCIQDLNDKADSVYVFISTDNYLKAGANGLLKNIVPLPGDRVRYEWKSGYPISYYLISFAVGNYFDYTFYTSFPGNNDSVPVVNYIYNNVDYLLRHKEDIDKTGDLLILFSELFGTYPFINEKYGHCAAPVGGGMEHQTMTTLSGFEYLLVAHELAHQWFGDNVTCASWQDIWINEGFASYSEYLAYEFLNSKTDAILLMDDFHDNIMNLNGGSVYIPENEINVKNRIFDHRLTYDKGAAIIHMLRQEIGDDIVFFDILRTFQNNYKDSVATGEDFKNLAEAINGRDFDQFFNQWYYGEGFPMYKITWMFGKDTLTIRSLQEPSVESQTVFNSIVEFRVHFYDRKDTTLRFRQIQNYEEFKIELPGYVKSLSFNTDKWLLAKLNSLINLSDSINRDKVFSISPNPVSDKLKMYFNSDPSDPYLVYISDMAGRLVKLSEFQERYHEIDLSFLKKGNYILLIEDKKALYPVRIVKI